MKIDCGTPLKPKKDFQLPGCFTQQLPILEVEAGKYLFNSNAASKYIFNKVDDQNSALLNKIDELVEWESIKLLPAVLPVLIAASSDKKEIQVDTVRSLLSSLNDKIGNDVYLLGPLITCADVIIWGSLYGAMQVKEVKESTSSYQAVNQWFEKLSSMPPFVKAVEEITKGKGLLAFKDSLDSYTTPLLTQNKHQNNQKKNVKTDESASTEETGGPSKKDIENAKYYWLRGREGVPKPRKYTHPILPNKDEKNILITAALPYVNNVPHLGNIIGCILSADVYARFCRLRNYNSLYICGTDEYGTATETKAIAEGITPQEICNKYNKLHIDIYKWFNIEFDYFGRTSTEQQTKITQDIFWKVHKNGFLLEDTLDQLQCVGCNRFLADRFVEGVCPNCKYEDARGDQCDACGKLINAIELIKPRCKQCGSAPVVKTSQHVFLNLPKVEPKLREWLKNSEGENWTTNAKQITKGWLADGLKPRCITRDLKWGTQVPLEGYTDKVFYVWFDAPIGYLSITANYTDQWQQWWKNPEQVRLVQFMAKDNVPFHTVVFPSSLLAADDNYTILNEISSTEYLNYEDDKFSKSRGVGVFGDHAESTGIPADIFRFYLLYVRPESQDSAFQWSDLILKNNSELLNNLGNFVNRALMFLKNSFDSTIPELQLQEEDYKLIASVNKDLTDYVDHLDKLKLRDGLRIILNITRAGNQYIQGCKPWVLVKGNEEEKARAGTVIGLAVNVSALVTVLIKPYMPLISTELQQQINLSNDFIIIPEHFVPMLSAGHKIGVPNPLFQKLDAALGDELKKRFAGQRDVAAPSKKKDAKSDTSNVCQVDPAKASQLEANILLQGDIVRKVKSEKANKEIIDGEVKKLLELKKQLAIAQGIDPNQTKKKGGKPAGKDTNTINIKNNSSPAKSQSAVVNPEEVTYLEGEVSKQGDIVRKVKSEKANKEIIDGEVKKLLELKKQLAIAQGIDPNQTKKKGGKKK